MSTTPYEVLNRMNIVQMRAINDILKARDPWQGSDTTFYSALVGLTWKGLSIEVESRLKRLEETPAILIIDRDEVAESPNDCMDDWKLTSFRQEDFYHEDFEDYLTFMNGNFVAKDIVLRKRLSVGLAFPLTYSSHGVACKWDIGERIDGILVWERGPSSIGAKTYKERREDAKRYLEMYTHWCNGEVYCYEIQNGEGTELDKSGTFYGYQDFVECLKSEHPELWDNVVPLPDIASTELMRIKSGIKIEGSERYVLD